MQRSTRLSTQDRRLSQASNNCSAFEKKEPKSQLKCSTKLRGRLFKNIQILNIEFFILNLMPLFGGALWCVRFAPICWQPGGHSAVSMTLAFGTFSLEQIAM